MNIKNDIVQQGEALVKTDVSNNFKNLVIALQKDITEAAITVKQSYLSDYDVIDELRKTVVTKPTGSTLAALFDLNKPMADIVNENNFDKVKQYVLTLGNNEFNPSLSPTSTSPTQKDVYTYPTNLPDKDPRRTAMLVIPAPSDIIKSTNVQKWLINNSMMYGFVLYGDSALYYLGLEEIKKQIKSVTNKQEGLKSVVGSFLLSDTQLNLLTTTADRVLNAV
jgi:hypothetical protein